MAILTVQTKHGAVRGLPAGNHKISVFKGIPYAAPPVGELRWRAPQAAPDWEGTLDAFTFSKIPIQPKRLAGTFYQKEFFPIDLEKSEDCLYLNIWTPAQTGGEKLPVAFWIYGGGYTTGYSNKIEFDGEAFAKRGCVFVDFNYRVGPMGFFAHPELSAESPNGVSGNYGILDQIAALRWVRENIEAFGGDPENITIFGQSAGAMSCMVLATSPLTDGMFQRAICESCGGLNPEMCADDSPDLKKAEKSGAYVLSQLGISSVEEARSRDALELCNQMLGVQQPPELRSGMPFLPNVDGYVLPEGSAEAIIHNRQKKIDYLVGSTSNEGWGFYEANPYQPEPFRKKVSKDFGEKAQEYLNLVGFDPASSQPPCDLFGDCMTAAGIAWNELEMKRGGQTAYQYYFTKTVPGDESGAFHSAEHAYIFGTLDRFDRKYRGSDYMLANAMCDYWTNFMKTGDPNGPGLPRWEKYGAQQEKVMEFGEHVGMIELPSSPSLDFCVKFMLDYADTIGEDSASR